MDDRRRVRFGDVTVVDMTDEPDYDEDDDDNSFVDLTEDYEEMDIDEPQGTDNEELKANDDDDDFKVIDLIDLTTQPNERAADAVRIGLLNSFVGRRQEDRSRQYRQLQQAEIFGDVILVPGMTVEFDIWQEKVKRNTDFLRIDKILQDRVTHDIFLRGEVYVRTFFLKAHLPDNINEVYLVRTKLKSDGSPDEPYLQNIRLGQVIRERTLIRTNALYASTLPAGCSRQEFRETGQLTCRWMFAQTYESAEDDPTQIGQEMCLRRLLSYEADREHAVDDRALRLQYGQVDDYAERHHRTKMTFGDFFGGGGGVGCGAKAAGITPSLMVDKDEDACRTYRRNFPEAEVFCQSVFDYLRSNAKHRLRIAHFSPPCQTFSAAHTVAGRNDDANSAAFFSVRELMNMTRPDIVTVEETSGVQTHHRPFLGVLVWQLTSLGYSVRWKILNCAHYGNPQPRKRMFMIASCPGQSLPPFPRPTHGDGPGLQRITTVHDAIHDVRPTDPNHNLSNTVPRADRPFDPRRPLGGCITTCGGQFKVHPSGKRDFTLQEFQRLQGFPRRHDFVGNKTSIMRQIGNACPPIVYAALLRPIIEALKITDATDAGEDAELEEAMPGGSQGMAIELD